MQLSLKIHVLIFMIRNITLSIYFISIFTLYIKVNITVKSRNLSTARYYKYSQYNMRDNISYLDILGLVLRKSGRTHPWSLVQQERSVVRISDILSKVIITSLGSIKMITKRKVKFANLGFKDKIFYSNPPSCDDSVAEGGISLIYTLCGCDDESQGCMCLMEIVWPPTLTTKGNSESNVQRILHPFIPSGFSQYERN